MLLSYDGEHLIDHPAREAFVETATLEKEKLSKFREKFPAYLDADKFSLQLR